MSRELKILILSENTDIKKLIGYQLDNSSIEAELNFARGRDDFEQAIINYEPDIILSDDFNPDLNGLDALKIAKGSKVKSPFILIADNVPEDYSVELIKHGIDEYVFKDRFDGLPVVIKKMIEKYNINLALSIYEQQYNCEMVSRGCSFRDKVKRNEIHLQQTIFKSIVELSDDAIISRNLAGTVTFWNNGAESIYGYTEREMLGASISRLIPDDYKQEESEIMERVRNGMHVRHYETMRRKKDGTLINISLTVSPVKNSFGEIVGASKIARDITERKKSEQELLILNEQLRNLNFHIQHLREEQLANITRESLEGLMQQMSSCKMEISWLKKHTMDMPEIGSRILLMDKKVNETINVIHEMVMDLRPTILDDFGLEAAIEWQTNEFQKKSGILCNFIAINITERFSREIDTAVFRIFQEAMNNVLLHAKATKVDITLSIDNGYLILEVKDDGVGISDERRDNIKTFGLLNMKETAAKLNGRFSVKRIETGGTLLHFKIPNKL